MNLIKRSINSITWNLAAQIIYLSVGVIRSIFLARYLSVEVFGIYALAGAVINLSAVLPGFGMSGALLHRSSESKDESLAASAHFSLVLLFTLLWALLVTAGILLFSHGQMRIALFVLMIVAIGMQFTLTPHTILLRRVLHRRLAYIQIVTVILASFTAILLAFYNAGLWALLSTDIVMLMVSLIGFYVVKPFFIPNLRCRSEIIKYFLRFGSQNFMNIVMLQIMTRIDKLWIGGCLGKVNLGFFSRAQRFAGYPNLLFSASLVSVLGGTFAELNGKRKQISQLFSDANALIIRSGAFFAGLFILTAPDLILLFLGEKWLPMLPALRYLLIYQLFSPVRSTSVNLLIAQGKPGYVNIARIIQLSVLGVGMYLLRNGGTIEGMALALNIMQIVGIGILYLFATKYVDFSFLKLFTIPILASIFSGYLAHYLVGILPSSFNDLAFISSAVIFSLTYFALLICFEFRYLKSSFRILALLKK